MNINILVRMNIQRQISKTTSHYEKNKHRKIQKGTEEAAVFNIQPKERTKAI